MKALVIADFADDQLSSATLSAITAASALKYPVELLVAGYECLSLAKHGANIPLVNKVYMVDDLLYAYQQAENMALLIQSLASNYSHIIAPASSSGKNYLPRAAALCDAPQISEITSIVDSHTFTRNFYAGNAVAKVRAKSERLFLTVRGTCFEPCSTTGGSADIANLSAAADSNLSRHLSYDLTNGSSLDLTSAKVVISGGRGLGSRENFDLLKSLANKLGAAIGATRAAVDSGYASNDMQVGQTGKIVAPDLYIAIGISGAIQHIAGIKDSKVIVAINNDPDAPIFQIADYGLVTDLFEAILALEQAL